jgi:hypothetical protein
MDALWRSALGERQAVPNAVLTRSFAGKKAVRRSALAGRGAVAQSGAAAKVQRNRGGAAMATKRKAAADEDKKPARAKKPRAKKDGTGKAASAEPSGPVPGADKAPEASVYIGQSIKPEYIWLRLANRHGLVTGATGTGKTVTLQGLAEGFSNAGVPVFCADVKGDLSGIAMKGEPKGWIEDRAKLIGYDVQFQAFPVIFWDLFGEQGHPIRATVSEVGPLLLSRLMNLNDTQEGVLNIAFRIAADEKLPIVDLKDLRALISNVGERSKELTTTYGNVAATSVGSIQRRLLVLEEQGADKFFGEPALDIADFMRIAPDGRGVVNLMTADKLMQKPRLGMQKSRRSGSC